MLALIRATGIGRLLAGHRGGVVGTVLAAVYLVGLVVAGIFHPDAAAGFPLGTSLHSQAPKLVIGRFHHQFAPIFPARDGGGSALLISL